MKRRSFQLLCVGVIAMSIFQLSACGAPLSASPESPQQRDGKYRNTVPRVPIGFLKTAAIGWKFLTGKSDATVPRTPIPVRPLTAAALLEAPDGSLYRLGHSTVLLKLDGEFWLTDPVFSERASPVQWAGPKRFHAPPIDIDELPPIKGVILSHDHFDHLDRDAIAAARAEGRGIHHAARRGRTPDRLGRRPGASPAARLVARDERRRASGWRRCPRSISRA
jgi:hypothetical protein